MRRPFSEAAARAGLLLSCLVAVPAAAPAQSGPGGDCTCLEAFERLVAQIEANHIGYAMVVDASTRVDYEARRAAVRARAASSTADDCVLVLRELTDWFRDGHLFVIERPRVPPDSVVARAARAEHDPRSEADLLEDLRRRRDRLDPIEGVWSSAAGFRVAIVRDGPAADDSFVGILLTDTLPGWRQGHVRARFRRRADAAYDAVVLSDDRAPIRVTASIHRDVLLHMPPATWGRAFPLEPHERETLDATDPRAPVLQVIEDDAVLVSVPSHDPAYAPRLEALVAAHTDAIQRAATLIIDLRGNEGGSVATTRSLMPFLQTPELRPRVDTAGVPTILASRQNIEYFRSWRPPTEVLERMEAGLDRVLSFPGLFPTEPWPAGAAATPAPRNVAILIDRGVVSAGEAFVLQAVRSTKVTLFGENTGGMIDFQNVHMVPLACAELGLWLGYPMIAAHDRLPRFGLNETGIAPHVRIPPGTADPVRWILDHYGSALRSAR